VRHTQATQEFSEVMHHTIKPGPVRLLIPALTMALVCVAGSSALSAVAVPNAAAASPGGGTGSAPLFGTTVFEDPGESYREAYRRVSAQYGGSLGAIRMFYPKLPASWDKITSNVDDTPVVVSFRADPSAVVSGQYDRELKQWFADAPTGRKTWWSYWHEPEDDGVSTTQYRRAWAHIRDLADTARNAQLRATLILMCWTLAPNSGRDWRDYYPGNDVIQVMAFDCYNTGRKNGVYRDPAKMLAPVQAVASTVGKPWGIAELGSTVISTDGGERGRAEWLRTFADEVQRRGASFATYFDSVVGFDYRLHDQPSRTAWRSIVQR
jgi:hypothetical protein